MVSDNCESEPWVRRKSSHDIEIRLIVLSVFIALAINSILEIIKIERPQDALVINVVLLILAIILGFWWHNQLLKIYDIHEYRLTTEIRGKNTNSKLEKIPKLYKKIKDAFADFPNIRLDMDLGIDSQTRTGLFSKFKKGFLPTGPVDESGLKHKENQLYEKCKSLNAFKIYFFNKENFETSSSYFTEVAYAYFDVGRAEDKVSIVCSCSCNELGISIRNKLDRILTDKSVTNFLGVVYRNF